MRAEIYNINYSGTEKISVFKEYQHANNANDAQQEITLYFFFIRLFFDFDTAKKSNECNQGRYNNIDGPGVSIKKYTCHQKAYPSVSSRRKIICQSCNEKKYSILNGIKYHIPLFKNELKTQFSKEVWIQVHFLVVVPAKKTIIYRQL